MYSSKRSRFNCNTFMLTRARDWKTDSGWKLDCTVSSVIETGRYFKFECRMNLCQSNSHNLYSSSDQKVLNNQMTITIPFKILLLLWDTLPLSHNNYLLAQQSIFSSDDYIWVRFDRNSPFYEAEDFPWSSGNDF